jgi:hypothetical protein
MGCLLSKIKKTPQDGVFYYERKTSAASATIATEKAAPSNLILRLDVSIYLPCTLIYHTDYKLLYFLQDSTKSSDLILEHPSYHATVVWGWIWSQNNHNATSLPRRGVELDSSLSFGKLASLAQGVLQGLFFCAGE